jgi:hypothetical protein
VLVIQWIRRDASQALTPFFEQSSDFSEICRTNGSFFLLRQIHRRERLIMSAAASQEIISSGSAGAALADTALVAISAAVSSDCTDALCKSSVLRAGRCRALAALGSRRSASNVGSSSAGRSLITFTCKITPDGTPAL